MPSSVCLIASAGQTRAHAGSSQCMQTTGDVCVLIGAVDKLQMNHGAAAMRVAFHAGLHAGFAADAARRIDEKVVSVHDATFSIAACADLVFGNLGDRIQRAVGEQIRRLLPRPVIGNENRVRPNRPHDLRRHCDLAAACSNADHVSVGDSQLCAPATGCISHSGSGY